MAAKKPEVRVKELMVQDVITVQPDDLLSEAVSLMFENRVSAVPVVDRRERCKGILSTTDLLGLFRKQTTGQVEPGELDRFAEDLVDANQRGSRLGDRRVEAVMTEDVVTVSLEDTLAVAAREMLQSRVHRLVVVDSSERVIGILSTMDLLEAFSAVD
ncbi:MAG: CBS domain-containing protein [bacterium]